MLSLCLFLLFLKQAMFIIFSMKYIIKQLLDSVFVICKIINVEVKVISRAEISQKPH